MRKLILFLTVSITFNLLFCFTNGLAQGWVQRSNFGGNERSFAEAFSIGNRGYMGVGRDAAEDLFSDFWEYDPATDTWTQVANFGGGTRCCGVSFSINGLGYLGLGYADAGAQADFWEYDPPPANTWTQKTDFIGTAMGWREGFATSTRGYVGTGHNGGMNYFNDFYEYDPTDLSNGTDINGNPMGAWRSRTNFGGVGRNSALGLSINDMGYMGLGYSKVGFTGYRNDFWEFNPTTNAWTQVANYPGNGRSSLVGFELSGRGYIGTGDTGAPRFADFWEYTPPPTNSWVQICDLGGEARQGAACFVIGNTAYVGLGLGASGTYHNDLWELQNTCGGALPVELLSFSAKWQDETYNTALIEWQTANETNSDYFEVERSIDYINFTSIVQINGAGNSNQIIKYQQLDTEPYKDGISYYRLKQVDYNGDFSYSQIETLNVSEGLEIINLYPNPTIDQLIVQLTSSLENEIIVSIKNSMGQKVREVNENISEGFNSYEFDVEELSTGNYFIEIATTAGLYKVERKFIKGNR